MHGQMIADAMAGLGRKTDRAAHLLRSTRLLLYKLSMNSWRNIPVAVTFTIRCGQLQRYVAGQRSLMEKRPLPVYHFNQSKTIVSLSADFLGTWLLSRLNLLPNMPRTNA